jgi:hypothetical protein
MNTEGVVVKLCPLMSGVFPDGGRFFPRRVECLGDACQLWNEKDKSCGLVK